MDCIVSLQTTAIIIAIKMLILFSQLCFYILFAMRAQVSLWHIWLFFHPLLKLIDLMCIENKAGQPEISDFYELASMLNYPIVNHCKLAVQFFS